MKKINKIFKTSLLTVALGCGTMLTSCTDFLTIYPTNSVIHENFWQTAEDVNGMLATCYQRLQSSAAIERMIVWGDLRGDQIAVRNNSSNTYKYIVEANLQDNNSYCTWAEFYQAINDANMVLEFAPEVVERDPDFTQGDLDIVLGEMYAIRALSHFYLVRTFRDIPLAYKASVNDGELIEYPQVHPMVALDSIMHDLERAEKLVMRSGGFPNSSALYNYGRVTRNAVRAMKADVNLWQAAFAAYYAENGYEEKLSKKDSTEVILDCTVPVNTPDYYYRQAVAECDAVLNDLYARMTELYENNPSMGKIELDKNPYYLVENNQADIARKASAAYNKIFGELKDVTSLASHGEVIFELVFDGTENNSNGNSGVAGLYGIHKQDGSGVLCVAKPWIAGAKTNTEMIYHEKDFRAFSNTAAAELGSTATDNSSPASSEVGIAKYSSSSSPGSNRGGYRESGKTFDANWIIYRQTDVMLMKAEALAMLISNETPAADSEDMEFLSQAFELVQAVNNRSLMSEDEKLVKESFSTKTAISELILNERARELAFEGKRWYDLVRLALRTNTTNEVSTLVSAKIEGGGASAVKKKLSTMNSLFFPIAKAELNVNPLLGQNPAYKQSSSVSQN